MQHDLTNGSKEHCVRNSRGHTLMQHYTSSLWLWVLAVGLAAEQRVAADRLRRARSGRFYSSLVCAPGAAAERWPLGIALDNLD